jgi:RND family efflux transporter MFP subunit
MQPLKETSVQPHDSESTPPYSDQSKETGQSIRRFAIIVAAVLIIAFLIVHFVKSHEASEVAEGTRQTSSAPALVNIITVDRGPASSALKLPGAAAAWYDSTIYARVDGYVGTWTADIGDKVKKGQVMATIETPDLDAQLASAVAKAQSDQAQVQASESALKLAQVTYERWRDAPKGVVSEQERDTTKANYEGAVAHLSSSKAQLVVDNAVADRYRAMSKFKNVTAPYDARVTERQIDIGNLVTAGSGANTTLLYKVSQNDPVRVFVNVPQSAAADMRVGVEAKVTASNLPGQVFTGKISRTADAIDQRTRTQRVEVDLPNPQNLLVPGTYVDVAFDIPTGGMPQVPAAALVFRAGGPQVALVDQNNQIRFRPVTIARDNGNSVEIESGVKPGDTLALNISSQIADGDKVQVSQSKSGGANAVASNK